MTDLTLKPSFLLVGLLLLAPASAFSQDEMSDKERRKAARAEQSQARAEEEAMAEAAAAAEEEEAEKLRLEELGAIGQGLPEAEKGFFVGIDAFFAEPSGPERTVARVGDIVTSAVTSEDLDSDANGLPDAFTIQNVRDVTLQYDSELAPRLEIGWRRGTGAAFSVRYWGYSADASVSASATQSFLNASGETGLILGGIDNQGFENLIGSVETNPEAFARPLGSPSLPGNSGLHGADSVTASGQFDASRFDLIYTHAGLIRPRLELHYRIGLSLVNAERAEQASYSWRSFEAGTVGNNGLALETVTARAETQAIGLLTGLTGRYGITEDRKWSLRGALELSALTNEADLSFRDSWITSQDGIDPLETIAQDTTASPSKSLMTTIEADLGVEGQIGSQLRLGLGYRYSNWLEAVTEQRYPSASNQAALLEETIDVDFSGPYIRLSWFF